MLTVVRVHLPSSAPIVGCELTPYVVVAHSDNSGGQSTTDNDVPETAPINGHFLRYKWYRIESDKHNPICSIHPNQQAKFQCSVCLKAKLPSAKSYHCSVKCFSDAWQNHQILHKRAASAAKDNRKEDDKLLGQVSSSGSVSGSSLATAMHRKGDETWFEVGHLKTYTPTADDIGHVLRFECYVLDSKTKTHFGQVDSVLTSRVIPAPSPTPRRLIPVNGVDLTGRLGWEARVSEGKFTVLSYNILADMHVLSDLYSYCPSWARSWTYRRQKLLSEIVSYHADIICLQEVQCDHFENFFLPELNQHGYEAVFLKRTNEVYTGDMSTIDGCATFYRQHRFSFVKKYEGEFNRAAHSLADAVLHSGQKTIALGRLVQDNVALVVILEAKFGDDNPGKPQLLCVANTLLHTPYDLKDVNLWQVQIFVDDLEKIAGTIPMVVCGDFRTLPGSAPHCLITTGNVDPFHPDLAADPLGIMLSLRRLTHQLPLMSAYSAFAMKHAAPGLEKQRRMMNTFTKEPLFTSYTKHFIGTVDYIFYSADSLTLEGLLELLDGARLRKDIALPSPEWASDHIALLAEFQFKSSRPQR